MNTLIISKEDFKKYKDDIQPEDKSASGHLRGMPLVVSEHMPEGEHFELPPMGALFPLRRPPGLGDDASEDERAMSWQVKVDLFHDLMRGKSRK